MSLKSAGAGLCQYKTLLLNDLDTRPLLRHPISRGGRPNFGDRGEGPVEREIEIDVPLGIPAIEPKLPVLRPQDVAIGTPVRIFECGLGEDTRDHEVIEAPRILPRRIVEDADRALEHDQTSERDRLVQSGGFSRVRRSVHGDVQGVSGNEPNGEQDDSQDRRPKERGRGWQTGASTKRDIGDRLRASGSALHEQIAVEQLRDAFVDVEVREKRSFHDVAEVALAVDPSPALRLGPRDSQNPLSGLCPLTHFVIMEIWPLGLAHQIRNSGLALVIMTSEVAITTPES